MNMSRVIRPVFLAFLLLFVANEMFAQYPDLRIEWADTEPGEDTKCLSVALEADYGVPMIPPKAVAPFLNCESGIRQSGEVEGRYLAWVDFPNIRLYDFKTNEVSTLMSVFDDGDGVSDLEWEDNGDGDDVTELVFININRKRYDKGTKLFHLTIDDGKLTEKFSDEIEAAIVCEGKNCRVKGFSFYDNTISYWSGNAHDQAIGLNVRNYFRPGEFDEMMVFNTGFNNWWAMASVYYFELIGPNGRVNLPQEVADGFAPHGRAILSPGNEYLYYFDQERNLNSYRFADGKVQWLMKLLPSKENLHFMVNMAMSPSGNRIAFTNENSDAYEKTGMKLFILDLENGKMTKKQSWEIAGDDLYKMGFKDENTFSFKQKRGKESEGECDGSHCLIRLD